MSVSSLHRGPTSLNVTSGRRHGRDAFLDSVSAPAQPWLVRESRIVEGLGWVAVAVGCLGGGTLGCGPSGYYYDASEGRVDCETDDMVIQERKSFGTRQWTVVCPDKKRYECKGTKGYATCVEQGK
jgi:hypothetical protein